MIVVIFVHRGCERLFVAVVLMTPTGGATMCDLVILVVLVLMVVIWVVVRATVSATVSATATAKIRAIKCHSSV